MNKCKLALVAALLGMASGHAWAADASVTIVYRKTAPVVGLNPSYGVAKATLVNPVAGVTINLPVPYGKTSNDIADYDALVYTSDERGPKPVAFHLVGAALSVSGTNMTSGTLANGDILKVRVYYK